MDNQLFKKRTSLAIATGTYLTVSSTGGFIMEGTPRSLDCSDAQTFEDKVHGLYAVGCVLAHYLDTDARSVWRLVNKDAAQAIYETTRRLSPGRNKELLANLLTSLPLKLMHRCKALKEVSFKGLRSLSNIEGLPRGIEVLDLSYTSVTNLTPLLRHHGEGSDQIAFNKPVLRSLILSGMKHGVVASLLPHLQIFTSLRRLDLGYNYLGAKGIMALAPSLQLMKHMQHLDLQGNYMCIEGVEALVPILMQLTELRQLHMGFNKLGPEGVVVLAPALKNLSKLQVLNLRGKGIHQT